MSNKLKKTITCEFCGETVKYTNECQKLFDKDVCPGCVGLITRIVNNMIAEHEREHGKESGD